MKYIITAVAVIAALLILWYGAGLMFWPGIYVSEEKVILAVEKQGYSDITVEDKDVFFVGWKGCSDNDDALFELTATNARGQGVELLACAGWPFKGVTIRTE
ncbi:MAG: hypothetical protein HYV34_01970 [Candidatus Kerfeldbacteria bacterium]|nr:hypothetical protein [Candidatus Kerfeldbacteria bacterium]